MAAIVAPRSRDPVEAVLATRAEQTRPADGDVVAEVGAEQLVRVLAPGAVGDHRQVGGIERVELARR